MSENALASEGKLGRYFTHPNSKFTSQYEWASGISHPCVGVLCLFGAMDLWHFLVILTLILYNDNSNVLAFVALRLVG